jgi:DNA-binding SARP family transcriptional activator
MLGAIEVVGGDGVVRTDLGGRPKALALLSFLALQTRSAPCSRDTILTYFWPDSTMHGARQALRQSLYELRQALGPDVVEKRGQHDVALNRDRITADAVEILDALDAGRVEEALEAYAGDLLPGLYFADQSPEFEAWLEGEREGLRRRLAGALWSAVDRALAVGETDRAIRLGGSALELEPYHEVGLRRVMQLLREEGRSAEAVRLYRRFRQRLASDLDLPCSGETEALAAAIQAGLRRSGSDAAPDPEAVTIAPSPPGGSWAVPASPPQGARGRPLHRTRRGTVLLAGVAAFMVVVGTAGFLLWYGSAGVRPGVERAAGAEPGSEMERGLVITTAGLAIGPIGSPESDPVAGATVATALSWVLSGREGGAMARIGGQVAPAGGAWSVALTVTRPDGSTRSITSRVPGDILSVVRAMGDTLAAVLDLPSEPAYAMLPESESALRAHVRGEWLLERGEVYGALEAFGRAVDADPAFALAHHRLSVAAGIAFDGTTAERAERVALTLQAQLPETEARIVEARRAYRAGAPDDAEALLRSVLATRPDHPEALFNAGEVLFHFNPLRGRPLAEARPLLEQAATRTVGRAESLYHLAQIALLADDIPAFDRASARSLELAPEGHRSLQVRALRARVMGGPDEWSRALAGLAAGRDLAVLSAAHNLAVYRRDLPAAMDVLGLLTREDREPGVRSRAHAARADLMAAAGRPSDVAAELRRAMSLDPHVGASRAANLLTLGVLPPDDPELLAIAQEVAHGPTRVPRPASVWISVESGLEPWVDSHARALAAAALGDLQPAGRLADQLDGVSADRAVRLIRADLARRTGEDLHGAAGGAGFVMRDVSPEEAVMSPLFSRPMARLLQGRADREQGRFRQADRWFASLLEHSINDLALAAVALGERARTAEQRGDTTAARRLDERLAEVHADAEPGYLPWRDRQAWAPAAAGRAADSAVPTEG